MHLFPHTIVEFKMPYVQKAQVMIVGALIFLVFFLLGWFLWSLLAKKLDEKLFDKPWAKNVFAVDTFDRKEKNVWLSRGVAFGVSLAFGLIILSILGSFAPILGSVYCL